MNIPALALISGGIAAGTLILLEERDDGRCIYLDANASTPPHKKVVAAVRRSMKAHPANPSSRHADGKQAADAIEKARTEVKQLVGATGDEQVIFTSGATEAINIGLQGTVRAAHKARTADQEEQPAPLHVLSTAIEHPAVLRTLESLRDEGLVELEVMGVDRRGELRLETLEAYLRPDTFLVAVMGANNEIGTIEPIGAIADRLADHAALLFVDGTQSVGFLPPHVTDHGIDLFALSAHKFYGPKGVGALVAAPGVEIDPVCFGGRQQGGKRPGTVATPLIVGLGEAARLTRLHRGARAMGLWEKARRLYGRLRRGGVNVKLNGPPIGRHRLPGNLSIVLPVDAKAVEELTPNLSYSRGSACACGKPSHVLKAIGADKQRIDRTIRIGIGQHVADKEVRWAAERLLRAIKAAEQAAD